MRNAISQLRDIYEWWRAEICAMHLWIFRVKRSGQPNYLRLDTRKDETQSFPSANGHQDAARFAYNGRYLALPFSSQNFPYHRSLEIAQAVAYEKTPFDPDAVSVIPIRSDGPQTSALIIKKSSLANFLDEAMARRAIPEALGIVGNGSTIWLPRRALETLHPIFVHLRRRRQWLVAAFAALLVVVGSTYMNLYLRYSAAEDQLTTIVDAKRDEALSVRKLLDRQQKSVAAVEAARTGKNLAVPAVRVWEELTRTTPDDAWITDLSFDGDAITLTGYATRSAGLIKDIASSPIFKDPGFVSPVVRVPGQAGERFELRAKVIQP